MRRNQGFFDTFSQPNKLKLNILQIAVVHITFEATQLNDWTLMRITAINQARKKNVLNFSRHLYIFTIFHNWVDTLIITALLQISEFFLLFWMKVMLNFANIEITVQKNSLKSGLAFKNSPFRTRTDRGAKFSRRMERT